MKVHVTKSYSKTNNPNNCPSDCAFDILRRLGILEMGIPDCPENSFLPNEISKLLDGIIASVGHGDMVILVLPTGNGSKFEDLLARKITIYSGKAPFILWTDNNYYDLYKENFSSNISGEYIPSESIESSEFLRVILSFITEGICDDDSPTHVPGEFIHVDFKVSGEDPLYLLKVCTALEAIIEHTDERIHFHVRCSEPLTKEVTDLLNAVTERGMHMLDFTLVGTDKLKNVKELWETAFASSCLDNVLCKLSDFPKSLQRNDDSAHAINEILTRVSEAKNLSASIEKDIQKDLTKHKDNLFKSISDIQRNGESNHE